MSVIDLLAYSIEHNLYFSLKYTQKMIKQNFYEKIN